ncbi:hypothetical protein ACFWPA_19045 [Rhodococcus sp. NPDC058505]|uniref:hypothetical protein n=1 Tax=unclassified Rhodococcus (in: high G+C Gram-positive bacteria) TaxID=192944 RepID=UPI00365ABDC0
MRGVVSVGLAVALCLGVSGCAQLEGTPIPASDAAAAPDPAAGGSSEAAEGGSSGALVDLMARIRGTDSCAIHDRGYAERWGTRTAVNTGPGLSGCTLVVGDGQGPIHVFELTMGSARARADIEANAETVGGHTVYRDPGPDDDISRDTCWYHLPQVDDGDAFGRYATLRVRRVGSDGKAIGEWPDRCAAASDYLARIIDRIVALPPRAVPVEGRSLIGKDPCLEDLVRASFPDWTVHRPTVGVGQCGYGLTRDGEAYRVEVEVLFSLNPEQALYDGARPITLAGLTGIESSDGVPDPGQWERPRYCGVNLTYRPSEPAGEWNGHLIDVEVHPKKLDAAAEASGPIPFDPCERVHDLATRVVAAVG